MAFCKRCGRGFIPKKEDQEYGPVCARKLSGQVGLDTMALVSGKVLKPKKETIHEYRNRQAVEAVEDIISNTPAPQKERVCRVCGCTDLTPCPCGCVWVEDDLCSAHRAPIPSQRKESHAEMVERCHREMTSDLGDSP